MFLRLSLVLLSGASIGASSLRAQEPCAFPPGVREIREPPSGGPAMAARPLLAPAAVDSTGLYAGWLLGRPGVRIQEHRHEGADEMLWITCGTLRLRLDGRDLDLVPGASLRIPAGAPHAAEAGPWGFVAVQVYRPGGPGLRFYEWPITP